MKFTLSYFIYFFLIIISVCNGNNLRSFEDYEKVEEEKEDDFETHLPEKSSSTFKFHAKVLKHDTFNVDFYYVSGDFFCKSLITSKSTKHCIQKAIAECEVNGALAVVGFRYNQIRSQYEGKFIHPYDK